MQYSLEPELCKLLYINTNVTLSFLRNRLISKLIYNKNTNLLTLSIGFKQFFKLTEDTIDLDTLLQIILNKYNITGFPLNKQYYHYYQIPVYVKDI